VRAVIDSGLARVAGHSTWSGLPTLEVARISQASAQQRAGRAGRTGPGRAIRLYPLEDFLRRPLQPAPEITRADLAPVVLLVDAIGLAWEQLGWLNAPPAAAVEQARELLARLGATGETAREMVRYPLHPRLGRLIVEARRRGVTEDGATVSSGASFAGFALRPGGVAGRRVATAHGTAGAPDPAAGGRQPPGGEAR
jgi:ATP-dependent helicase HrpB